MYSKIVKTYRSIVCMRLDRCSEKKNLLQVTGTYVITNDLLSSALEAFDCLPYVYHLVLEGGGGGGEAPPPPKPLGCLL